MNSIRFVILTSVACQSHHFKWATISSVVHQTKDEMKKRWAVNCNGSVPQTHFRVAFECRLRMCRKSSKRIPFVLLNSRRDFWGIQIEKDSNERQKNRFGAWEEGMRIECDIGTSHQWHFLKCFSDKGPTSKHFR